MTGYSPAITPGFLADAAKREFYKAVQQHLRFQDKTRINWIPLESAMQSSPSFYTVPSVVDPETRLNIELVDYSDYFDIREDEDIEALAGKAGFAAASGYNLLLGAAMRKYGYGLYATELLMPSDNLNFTVMLNHGPSLSDPTGLLYGWMAWRFKFGAGAFTKAAHR